jgi:serralysin
MIDTNIFSHTGANGSSPGDRMSAAGYNFTGSWAWAENIAWMSTRAPEGLQDEVQQLHTNLMNFAGHRANLLNDTYREIGVGFEVGQFDRFDSAFVTQNFARTGTDSFLTGVVFGDQDGDSSYDIGEQLDNLTISARNNSTGATETTTSNQAGGYALALNNGNYTVSFSGNGFATQDFQANIGDKNVKLDLIGPTTSDDTPAPEPTLEPAPEPIPEPVPEP